MLTMCKYGDYPTVKKRHRWTEEVEQICWQSMVGTFQKATV